MIKETKTEEAHEEKKREIAIPGEVIVKGKDYLPGEGARREGEEIIASRFGLADVSGRLVKVIPLTGSYIPRLGNVIIGRVTDINFNGWMVDIKATNQAFLLASDISRYLRGELTDYYDVGDVMACKIVEIKPKGIDLTIRAPGLGKLENGIIIHINSNKVPRVIGREGSMIKLIKQETNCDIVVGQNGVVWISGKKIEDELKAKEAIMFVVNKSFVEGLTEKLNAWFKEKK